MVRILVTSLAFCLLILSAGKGYAVTDIPVSHGDQEVMSVQACNMSMAATCGDMDSGGELFSHFNCHLNMTSLISGYSTVGLMGLPSPNYKYQFSSKEHIQALATKPPQSA